MSDLTWTETQFRRLKELGGDIEKIPGDFSISAIITKSALSKMTISEDLPFFRQVDWLNDKQGLRSMLVTNLC